MLYEQVITAYTREYESEVRAAEAEYEKAVAAARHKLQEAEKSAFARYEARSHLLSIQLPKSWTDLLANFTQVMVENEPLENRFRLNGYLRPEKMPQLSSDGRGIVDSGTFGTATWELWEAFAEFRTRNPNDPGNYLSADIYHSLPDCSHLGFQIRGVRLYLHENEEGGLIANTEVHVWTPTLQAAYERGRAEFLARTSSLPDTHPGAKAD